MKNKLFKSDWFFGLIVVLIFLLLASSTPMQSLERVAYDFGVRATERSPDPNISIIAIDDESIANIGRWPWSRDIHAQLIEMLNVAGASDSAATTKTTGPELDKEVLDEISVMLSQSWAPEVKAILTALEKDREKRYQTGNEMAVDLRMCAATVA